MQVKLKSIIKKAEDFFKKIENVANKKDKSSELNLLIPDDNYLKLRSRYYSYKNLLLKNNELLDTLSEIEERIETKTITLQTFRSYLARIFDTAFGFIQSLNDMAENRYLFLYDVLERIRLSVETKFKGEQGGKFSDLVVPLEKITAENFKDTGAKAGNLGEIRNIMKLPTPRGFSITVQAYKDFMSFNNLTNGINDLLGSMDINNTVKLNDISSEIQEMFRRSEIPPNLKEKIYKEADKLGEQKSFAVRSSAVGEDGTVSFAGQFRSILNVKRDSLADAYKQVVASKYTRQALFYRLAKGIKDKNIPMAVFVLEMVNARSAGVLYTLNPSHPEKDETLISSVWGQGQYAVSGTVSPDVYILDRENNGMIINKTVSRKEVKLELNPSGGVKEVPVHDENRDSPSLSEHEINVLYNFSCLIERHFGKPQDIEWAVDENGSIEILQARPLHIKRVIFTAVPEAYPEEHLVLLKGETASRGVASGPVYIIDRLDQISDFPEGAVLVAKSTSNELVSIMKSCSAIVIETGSATSHLATVAREFNIPTVINARNIKEILRHESVVTVDANTGRIYRGRIESLLHMKGESVAAESFISDENIIRNAMKDITPLNLVEIDKIADVGLEEFQTIHDIIRFVHEVSVKEMFRMGEFTEDDCCTQQLVSDHVPMYFYIIDLDGGVVDEARFLRKITPEQIRSIPFKALWSGMTHKGVKWSGPVDIHMAGLASVMARSFVRTGVSEKGGKVYVIITDQYINLSVKLAYHFSVIDTFCGESYINNYINFRFQGGGSSAEGRARRTLFLKEILEAYDFKVEIKGDMVLANIKGASQRETEEKLDILGRLMGCSRQLDMAISSMEAKDWYVKAFLEENYSFAHE